MEDFTATPLVIIVTKIEDFWDACLMIIQAEDTSAGTDLKVDFMELDEVSVSNIYDLDTVIVKLCDCCKVLSTSNFYTCNIKILNTYNFRTK